MATVLNNPPSRGVGGKNTTTGLASSETASALVATAALYISEFQPGDEHVLGTFDVTGIASAVADDVGGQVELMRMATNLPMPGDIPPGWSTADRMRLDWCHAQVWAALGKERTRA